MNPTLLTIRAVGAVFAHKLFFTVALTVGIVVASLLLLALWLTTLSAWWWLLVVPVIVLAIVVISLLRMAKRAINSVEPPQSEQQKLQVKKFVEKLEQFSEITQTPKVILLYRVAKDVARPRANGFIGSIGQNASSLKNDFKALEATFK